MILYPPMHTHVKAATPMLIPPRMDARCCIFPSMVEDDEDASAKGLAAYAKKTAAATSCSLFSQFFTFSAAV